VGEPGGGVMGERGFVRSSRQKHELVGFKEGRGILNMPEPGLVRIHEKKVAKMFSHATHPRSPWRPRGQSVVKMKHSRGVKRRLRRCGTHLTGLTHLERSGGAGSFD